MFVYSKEDCARGIVQTQRQFPFPTPFKRTKIAFYGATDGHYGGVSFLSTVRKGINTIFYDVIALEINSPVQEVIEQLNAFQPDRLTGYVTGTKILAEKQHQGVLKIC